MTCLDELIQKYPEMEACREDIQRAFELLKGTYVSGGKTLVCGNGGSAADSEHIVGELMKGYLKQRPVPQFVRSCLESALPQNGIYLAGHLQEALPAISLVSQVALNTAFANDVAADMTFAQQVYVYGRPGDCLWVLSTSGTLNVAGSSLCRWSWL